MCYLAAVPLSRLTVFPEAGLALMWMPSAVFVGLIARRPHSWLPLMAAAAAAAEFVAATVLQGVSFGPALLWVIADVAAVTLCGVLARATGAYRLDRPTDFLKFLIIVPAVVAATATVGALGASWAFGSPWLSGYIAWFIGSTSGILVAAPMFMRFRLSPQISLARPIETAALSALVLILAAVSFLTAGMLPVFAIDSFLLLPAVVWLALRVGMNPTSVVVPLAVYIGAYAASHEVGLTAVSGSGLDEYLATAAFLVATALTSYAVATVAEAQADSVRELRRQATTDSLTGLPNRRAVLERIDELIAVPGSATLVMLDIVGFQHINDSLGHIVGDQLLHTAGERLAQAAGPERLVSRISSDEFVVLGADLSETDSWEFADRMRACLTPPIALADRLLTIDADCGVAVATTDSEIRQLLANADIALMAARRSVGPTVCVFSSEIARQHTRESQARTLIHQALDHDRVRIHMQPVFHTATGALDGAEVLMRLDDAEGRCHLPAEFIDVAEASGLIVPLGRIVLRQSLEWVVAHGNLWHGRRLAVNVSVRELADPQYVSNLVSALHDLRIPTGTLVLEVTERTILDLGSRAVHTLDQLRAAGVRIALDDFGTGYSSISALRGLPIDIIKIDQSFVSGLPTQADDVAIVAAVHNLARDLGLTTVAEGVETPEQSAMLAELGVTHLQGFLLGRPCPPEEFVTRHLATPTG